MGKLKETYTCPMHPDVLRDGPGLCPECGMSLVLSSNEHRGAHAHDHKDRQNKHKNIFTVKFWVSLALTIPVVLYSDILDELFGWSAPAFVGSEFVPLVLGSVVFFYGGWLFISSAYREVRGMAPGMMTLISLAIITAYVYSIFVVFTGEGNALFWELTTLITVMLLGHWMEMRSVQSAQGALKALSQLLPDDVEILKGDKTETIPLGNLKKGDIAAVRPGGRIPADGVVFSGQSELDESMITGESAPVSKSAGDEVIAGTINGNGSLKIKITDIGENTFLAGIIRLVEDAQMSKSKLQLFADHAAFYLTVIAIVSGLFVLFFWTLSAGDFGYAIERMVAVLVIACPHALGLAIPLVAAISTAKAAQNGFLVKKRISLELARKIDVVLFDKTGTLTKGEYGVSDIWPVNAKNEKDLLTLAACVDAHSEHFVSKAIVNEAKKKGIEIFEAKNFSRMPGKGVKGEVDGREILVGGAAILEGEEESIPANIAEEIESENKKGKTVIYALSSGVVLGAFALADIVREESRDAVSGLKEMGVRIAMMTGDNENVAAWVAEDLGLDEYFSKVMPQDKAERIKDIQAKGMKVAMVGDGINDAPALVQADLGIAIGAGTNVAIESAGIILVRNDPRDIAKIIRLSHLTFGKMVQNLFWAAGYNVAAIPLAGGILAAQGFVLNPAVSAFFMSLSTVIVAVNALFLKWRKI